MSTNDDAAARWNFREHSVVVAVEAFDLRAQRRFVGRAELDAEFGAAPSAPRDDDAADSARFDFRH